jgi:hypothetical protein
MENEQNGQQPEAENFPLDEAMISILSEIKQQVTLLQAQRQGALVHFIRQHKLQGNWQEAENGKELVKVPQQMQQMPQ